MTVLVTGAAGFIGFHVARKLLDQGKRVIGIDNLNDYYDVSLKEDRLAQIKGHLNFTFHKMDISDQAEITNLFETHSGEIENIIHLAAQAGVRYSLINPHAYIQSNITGHLNILEASRKLSNLKHLVYASSSSVYGLEKNIPFSIEAKADQPASLYAATKRCDELMSHTYAHLYKIPQTGLRFFTVYGPWGRPDMAAFLFCDTIRKRKPIQVFNHGKMRRDFTYIDDIVAGVLSASDHPAPADQNGVPHRVFNLGNNKSEDLMEFIGVIEKEIGLEAVKEFKPMQMGDIETTYADISESETILGYAPKTSINEGIAKFVLWYKDYYKL